MGLAHNKSNTISLVAYVLYNRDGVGPFIGVSCPSKISGKITVTLLDLTCIFLVSFSNFIFI